MELIIQKYKEISPLPSNIKELGVDDSEKNIIDLGQNIVLRNFQVGKVLPPSMEELRNGDLRGVS